ncbi:hypothetical protein DSM112329_03218 [Paraconexibacter sp. AEG42_29]|uniref:Calcium-binding protein n=1 Tax=Paraconexibacter sp. AEG42_29 TaxID=2997339 RepID=A0AAU7AXL1_9ACTN
MRHLLRRPVLALVPFLLAVSVAGVSQADHIIGTSCGGAAKCAGHEFWPKMTLDDVQKTPERGTNTLRGKAGTHNDELLGWHGSDTLLGGDGDDVLWADHIGTNQPKGQVDVLSGGNGNDFLYSAAGRNTMTGGPGNDAIKARYGRGTVNCGPGRDIVHLPKSRRKNWKFSNCEKYEYRSESATGQGLKTLP